MDLLKKEKFDASYDFLKASKNIIETSDKFKS
jgi:hypothetical protein